MFDFLRIAIALTFVYCSGFSQTILDLRLQNVNRQSLPSFLRQIEEQQPVKFFFLEDWIAHYEVDERFNGYPLKAIFDELFRDTDIDYLLMFDQAVILRKDPSASIQRESIIRNAVIQRKTIEKVTIGRREEYRAGQRVTLQGIVLDHHSRRALSGVRVVVNDGEAKITNEKGEYEFRLLPGEYVLTFHNNNYDDKVIDLSIYRDGAVDVILEETPILLEEVVVSDQAHQNSVGRSNLNMTQVKRLPAFLGEVDVIKQIQAQPGVTTTGELASGFNVRGGSVDQNLVLFDDVPIFNTSHALGFFSAFNPDAISEVQFYRGGIPSQFGGRASSVLNIVSRQGDYIKWHGSGGIGVASSYFTIGGPIRKDATSMIVSARSSYSDWMLKAIRSNYKDAASSSMKFYDGLLKVSHKFSGKSQLTLSGYTSRDAFSLADDTTYYWRNYAGSIRYDHSLGEKLFSSSMLTFGRYQFMLAEEDVASAFNLTYSITYPSLKIDFQTSGPHAFAFGFHNTYYDLQPGRLVPTSSRSSIDTVEMLSEASLESALYISDGFALTNKLSIEAGLRYSIYNRLGPATVYAYNPDAPRETWNTVDSTSYDRGEISARYQTPEPRISLRYQLSDHTSLRLGYHRMAQYLHLITNSAAMTPTDIWQSSNAHFRPQIAGQISAGLFRNFPCSKPLWKHTLKR